MLLDRAPEILHGATTYSTTVDIWSVGCIFAELILKQPLFQAKDEIEMISMVFKLLGPPGQDLWPDYYTLTLPLAKTISFLPFQPPQFQQKFRFISDAGIDLRMKFLTSKSQQKRPWSIRTSSACPSYSSDGLDT